MINVGRETTETTREYTLRIAEGGDVGSKCIGNVLNHCDDQEIMIRNIEDRGQKCVAAPPTVLDAVAFQI